MNTSGFISQSQTEEKAKYNVVTKKLTSLISIFDKLYGKSFYKKLIKTDYNSLKLTSMPSVILDNIKVNHPLVKLTIEYVKKLDTLGDSSKYFLMIVKYLIDESYKIIEKGVKPTVLGEIYRDIGSEFNDFCKDFVQEINIFEDESIEQDIKEININDSEKTKPCLFLLLDSLIKERKIKDLLIEAINKTKSFSTEKIRVNKISTGTIDDSYLVEGMIFERMPDSIKKDLENGTSSIYNCPLDISRAELKSTILMNTSEELYNFSKEEINLIKEKVDSLKSDLIICSGKVDNIFLDLCNRSNKVIFKIMSKHDLRRIRDCLGGDISPVLEPIKNFGHVKKMSIFEEGNKSYTKFLGSDMQTIVLKSSLDVILDEHERIINKTLRALSKNIKNNKIEVVEGSGTFEKQLTNFLVNQYNSNIGNNEETLNRKYAFISLSNVFSRFKQYDTITYDIYSTKLRAIKYSLDFIAVMYETEDYLIGIQEKLNIKPRLNDDWDEDH